MFKKEKFKKPKTYKDYLREAKKKAKGEEKLMYDNMLDSPSSMRYAGTNPDSIGHYKIR